MMTAETVLSLSAVAPVLLVVLVAVNAGVTRLWVVNAARTTTRQAVIGQGDYADTAQRMAEGVNLDVE